MFYDFFVDIRGRGGPLINGFLRVYSDVFRQSSHFNFRSSKQNSFYVFRVFVDNRGSGGPLINVFLKVYFDVFCHTSRFKFRSSRQSSFYVL